MSDTLLTDRPELLEPSTGIIKRGTVTYYMDLLQGSDEWLAARLGILTASEMRLIFGISTGVACGAVVKSGDPCSRSAEDGFRTCKQHRAQEETAHEHPATVRILENDKTRTHLYELAAQRITAYVEPQFVSDDMMRGHEDEMDACMIYADKCAPLTNCGFITNDRWGFTLGYSPDGLVGDDGLVECKSRRQKYQVQTIIDNVVNDRCETIPAEYVLQCQTGLLVSERKWLDFVSYSGGLPMFVNRVWPDDRLQSAIIEASEEFEHEIAKAIAAFEAAPNIPGARVYPTERKIYEDILT